MRQPHHRWTSLNQGKTSLFNDANENLTFGRAQDSGEWEASLRVNGQTFQIGQGKAADLAAAQLAAEDALAGWLAAAQRELASAEGKRVRTWGW